jgi:hypothetical protein
VPESILRLHSFIVRLEAEGHWFFADQMRKILEQELLTLKK